MPPWARSVITLRQSAMPPWCCISNTWKPWLRTTSIYISLMWLCFCWGLTRLGSRSFCGWSVFHVSSVALVGCPGNTPHDENRSTNHPLSGPPELEKPQGHVHASPIKHWWKTVLMAITSREHFQPAAQGRKTVLAAGSQLACMEVFRARGAAGDTDWDY